MHPKAIFVDTWGWIAPGCRRDPHHDEVKRFYQKVRHQRVPIYTSDYVLDEVVTLVFRREHFDAAVRFIEGILAASALGHVRIERVTPDRFLATWNLRKHFQDKPRISFTDLTSMVIMDERSISQVLTADEHFVQVGMGFSRVPQMTKST